MKPNSVNLRGMLVEIGLPFQAGQRTVQKVVIHDEDSLNQKHPSVLQLEAQTDDAIEAVSRLHTPMRVWATFTVRGIEYTSKKDGVKRQFNKLLLIGIGPVDQPKPVVDDAPVGREPEPPKEVFEDPPF